MSHDPSPRRSRKGRVLAPAVALALLAAVATSSAGCRRYTIEAVFVPAEGATPRDGDMERAAETMRRRLRTQGVGRARVTASATEVKVDLVSMPDGFSFSELGTDFGRLEIVPGLLDSMPADPPPGVTAVTLTRETSATESGITVWTAPTRAPLDAAVAGLHDVVVGQDYAGRWRTWRGLRGAAMISPPLRDAQFETDPETGLPAIHLEFDASARTQFAALTRKVSSTHAPLLVLLGGSVISAPRVQHTIHDGDVLLTLGPGKTRFDIARAKEIASAIRNGALPCPLRLAGLNELH